MVSEKNDPVSVDEQTSNETENTTSPTPQTEEKKKATGARGRSKTRSSRKQTVSPKSTTPDEQADAKQNIVLSTADAEASSVPYDAAQAEMALTDNTAESNKDAAGTKRSRKTTARSARSSRSTTVSSRSRKKNVPSAQENVTAEQSPHDPQKHAEAMSTVPPDTTQAGTDAAVSHTPPPVDSTVTDISTLFAEGTKDKTPAQNPESDPHSPGHTSFASETEPKFKLQKATDNTTESDSARLSSPHEEDDAHEDTATALALKMSDTVANELHEQPPHEEIPETAIAEPGPDMPEEIRLTENTQNIKNAIEVPSGYEADAKRDEFFDSDSTETDTADTESYTQKAFRDELQEGTEDPAPYTDNETQLEACARSPKKGKRKMFISVQAGEQAEVVLTEDGIVEEYYVEMQHQAKTKGNIYKGTIHNIDANLQAAFVSYGAEKNGFLQIDEVHPEYYLVPHEPSKGKKYPLMQKVLRPGQEVLVQVVKEPTGSKGAFLTTYLSLPGRFLVLTPGSEQIGVSRKVDNAEERKRLRSLLEGLDPGPGLGVIVRTVSFGASKAALQRDFQYLTRLWKDIRSKGTVTPSPCLLHREPDLATRAVRDYLTDDVNEIWVDDEDTATSIREVIGRLFPRRPGLVKTHRDQMQTLWERFSLLKQLEQIYAREVFLPSGGRLVFDQTEALTAIDINSGKTSGKNNFEAMALRTNQEAAEAIARQLRLRDLGGQVVIDFIEMRDRNHWREVEKTMRNAMKVDRARYDVGKISNFGLMELVRQRLGSSALSITMECCPLCRGTGLRRNMEWQSQQALREIKRRLRSNQSPSLICEFDMELALYLLNNKRSRILELEREFDQRVEIHPRH